MKDNENGYVGIAEETEATDTAEANETSGSTETGDEERSCPAGYEACELYDEMYCRFKYNTFAFGIIITALLGLLTMSLGAFGEWVFGYNRTRTSNGSFGYVGNYHFIIMLVSLVLLGAVSAAFVQTFLDGKMKKTFRTCYLPVNVVSVGFVCRAAYVQLRTQDDTALLLAVIIPAAVLVSVLLIWCIFELDGKIGKNVLGGLTAFMTVFSSAAFFPAMIDSDYNVGMFDSFEAFIAHDECLFIFICMLVAIWIVLLLSYLMMTRIPGFYTECFSSLSIVSAAIIYLSIMMPLDTSYRHMWLEAVLLLIPMFVICISAQITRFDTELFFDLPEMASVSAESDPE